ncbi:unnamed protein product [Durusdinium trenchii]|uniref:RNA-dependent RNA polymerase n=1 Tax=Durusdinium trenchii TaxID=1381693 RepID=A0ABP0RDF7_9DINO
MVQRIFEKNPPKFTTFTETARKSARKVASRLELLQSPGHVVSGFTAANLEAIPEPLTKASGGCGFINQRDLQRLTEHLGTRTEKFKAATSVQVRIFGASPLRPAAQEEFRQEAFVVGVADPTGQLPEGQIFISGLQEQLLSQGMSEVLVTRCPCVRPSDGKRLRVVTCRPPGMAEEAWRFLTSRSFGEVIFPRASDVGLPELIAEGDLDGDLYWICHLE